MCLHVMSSPVSLDCASSLYLPMVSVAPAPTPSSPKQRRCPSRPDMCRRVQRINTLSDRFSLQSVSVFQLHRFVGRLWAA